MKLFSKEINEAISFFMENNPKTFFFGEDIKDPYGGAFGISRGLSTKFPDRVINTPISEAGIVGMCHGISSEGFNVFLELMFGDFVLLVLDQVHNNMSKVIALSKKSIGVPLVIRTPMGGYRGYGPTHSQTLTRFLVGSDNIEVVTASRFVSPKEVFNQVFKRGKPCFYIEDKMTYPEESALEVQKTRNMFYVHRIGSPFNDVFFECFVKKSKILVLCVGGSLRLALSVAQKVFMENEIATDLIQINSIWPMNTSGLREMCGGYQKLVFIEEGWTHFGISSEIIASIVEVSKSGNIPRIVRIGAKGTTIPSSHSLEKSILPSETDIEEKIIDSLTEDDT
jgi:2-oxoisovalerate dehydrogenase E1 component